MTPIHDDAAGRIRLDPDEHEVDLDAHIAACRPGHRVMGLYLYAIHRELVRHGVRTGVPSWHPFELYPLADVLRLVRVARLTIHARETDARAVYLVGVDAMRTLVQTTVGRFMLSRRALSDVLAASHEARTVRAGRVTVLGQAERQVELLVEDRPLPAVAHYGAMAELARLIEPGATLQAWLGPERSVSTYRLTFAW